jgi:hypothetical protein
VYIGPTNKTPFEEVNRSVDFSALVLPNSTLSLVSVTATDSSGDDVTSAIIATSPAPSITGNVVTFRLIGGTANSWYFVSTKVEDQTGQEFEGVIILTVNPY